MTYSNLIVFQVWIITIGLVTAETGVRSIMSKETEEWTKYPMINPEPVEGPESKETTIKIATKRTTIKATQQPIDVGCYCTQFDHYGSAWISPVNVTSNKRCKEGAVGNMTWTCNFDQYNSCQFYPSQPDYSRCHSLKLLSLSNDIMDNNTDLMDNWNNITKFTSRADAYYGHEIFQILDLITLLLDRQESEMQSTTASNHSISYLALQIDSSRFGAETINNLISHDFQWDQLVNAYTGDEAFLRLLEVSDDIALRLSTVAKSEDQSLRCDMFFPNVTISASFWDGSPLNLIYSCDLTNDNFYATASEAFLRFPVNIQQSSIDHSYILLPEEILLIGKAHMASGVLIPAMHLIQQLLPGEKNTISGKDQKQLNSPLISFVLHDPEAKEMIVLPENSHVELIYEHGSPAKYPPIRTLRRWLEEGEEPSAVFGSSFCSYLLLNKTMVDERGDESLWIWDDGGCKVVSSNRTHTICHCNHLTGFANLMDFHDYIGPSIELKITSAACSIISILCIGMAMFLHTVFWNLRLKRTPIILNLCLVFLISHLLILFTLDRHFLDLDDLTCAIMGALLHFFLLASYMWFFIEGLQLYRLLTNVFRVVANSKWTTYSYFAIAYLVPFIVVGTTELVASFSSVGIIGVYSTDEKCWLVGDKWIWSFVGPFLIINLVVGILMSAAMRTSKKFRKSTRPVKKWKVRKILGWAYRGFLICAMLMWTMGFLLFADTIVLDYVFAVANCLQGVIIFVDRCVLNSRIRAETIDCLKRFKIYLVKELRDCFKQKSTSVRSANYNPFPLPIWVNRY